MRDSTSSDIAICHSYTLYAGYPGCEFQIREKLAEVIGSEKSEFFFDKVSNQFESF